ncbi:hypothetical protein BJX65DRAFT_183827 [Aspergillus insuetus]
MSRGPNRFAAVFGLLTYRACHDSGTLESLGLSIVHFALTHTSQDPPQSLGKAHTVSPIRRHHVPYKGINLHAEARGIPSQTHPKLSCVCCANLVSREQILFTVSLPESESGFVYD